MKNSIPLLALCLLILFASARPGQQTFEKITVQEFELVDEKGVQRASIKVEEGGEVMLRLFDQEHTIRVKIGANSDGSGIVLLDANTNPGIHILSKKEGGKVNVLDAAGKKRDL
jgi:hypothetical protein